MGFKNEFSFACIFINMSISRTRIYISTSDIASFIGQSTYNIVAPFEKLLNKYDVEYKSILKNISKELDIEKKQVAKIEKIINKTIQQEQLIKKFTDKSDNVEMLTNTKKELVEKAIPEFNDINNNIELNPSQKKTALLKVVKELEISDSKKEVLVKNVNNVVNTTHGTKQEDSAIEMYKEKISDSIVLDTSQKLYSRLFKTTDKHEWYICGRLDAICNDTINPENSYILEVKNRIHKFFTNTRDYEKTQMQIYMWLLEITPIAPSTTILEERLNKKIRLTKVYKDQEYIVNTIKQLSNFVECFETFMNNSEEKRKFILSNDKTTFINQLYYPNDCAESEECLLNSDEESV